MQCYKLIILLLFSCNTIASLAQELPSPVFTGKRVDSIKNSYRSSFANGNITDYSSRNLITSSLSDDLDLSSFELISANVSFKEKDNIQKLGLTPLRLLRLNKLGSSTYLGDFKLNFTTASSSIVAGIGWGWDNSYPGSRRSLKITKKVFESFPAPEKSKNGESMDEYKKRVLNNYEKKLDSMALDVYEKRARSVFSFTIGYSHKFFPILSASSDDPVYDSTNYYGTESNVISISSGYSYKIGCISFAGALNFYQTRKGAAQGLGKIPFTGYTISVNKRVARFITDRKRLRRNEAYINSLFIPGIHIGLTYDRISTNSQKADLIKDKIVATSVWTPSIDILIAPAAQFRIALPFSTSIFILDEKTRMTGASVTYLFKLSNLSK